MPERPDVTTQWVNVVEWGDGSVQVFGPFASVDAATTNGLDLAHAIRMHNERIDPLRSQWPVEILEDSSWSVGTDDQDQCWVYVQVLNEPDATKPHPAAIQRPYPSGT